MRRLLYFLAGATMGAGLLIMLSGGTGAGMPFGIAFCVLLVVAGVVGGRWGPGPIARGVRAPELARAGAAVALLSALGGAMLLWRPALGAGVPVRFLLICMAAAGLLLVPVGLMGRPADNPE